MSHVLISIVVMLLMTIGLSSCGPQTQSPESRAAAGRSKTNLPPSQARKFGSSDSSSPVNYSDIDTQALKGIPDTASAAELAKLSLGNIKLLLAERTNQDKAEDEQYDLLVAMNKALCERLNEVRSSCPASARLASSGLTRTLNCDGTLAKNAAASGQISVTLPSGLKGKYMLLANDTFQSTTFSGGTSDIRFRSVAGGDDLAPKFLSVYKLVIRSAEGRALPDRESVSVQMRVNGHELLFSKSFKSEDPKFAAERSEYKLDVSQIISLRESSRCKTTKASINNLKSRIRQAVEDEQARQRSVEYQQAKEPLSGSVNPTESGEKAQLINEIFEARANIQTRLPVLEREQDRLYKLTNELTDDNSYGCHYREKINSVQLVVDGSENPLVHMGTFSNSVPEPVGGSPTALEFRLGGLSFSVDPATKILGGSHFEVDADFSKLQLAMGAIEYLSVKKLGISYNQERRCKQNFIIMEKCNWQVSEEHVYYINGIQLIVNGLLVYKRDGLDWKFDRKRQIWEDSSLRSNSNWISVMLRNDCEKVD